MVLFPPPFYFVFDTYRTYKIISSCELARPVMGTTLVYIYRRIKKLQEEKKSSETEDHEKQRLATLKRLKRYDKL